MEKSTPLGEIIIRPFDFHSGIKVNLDGADEEELYITMTEEVIENMVKLQQASGSGWRLHSIIKLELHTVRYNPLRGETYFKLPKELGDKNAIINPKNEDNKCFLWCVLRALNSCEKKPAKNR